MNILGGHYSADHRSYEHLRAVNKDEIILGKVENQENTVTEAKRTFLGGRHILVKCRQEVNQDKD